MKIAVLFSRLGPYHHARLSAAAHLMDIVAIEYSTIDRTYDWQPVTTKAPFSQITLFQYSAYQDQSASSQQKVIRKCLNEVKPAVVLIPGWSSSISLMALVWCRQHSIPVVLMSESTEYDEIRYFWKELPKPRILKNISTALAGGQPHQDYLMKLGLPQDRIFLGYDVVDNIHFAQGAAHARRASEQLHQELKLPPQFFLASARFVEKKNLDRLLSAYACYQMRLGTDAWSLVVLGDGALKSQLCHQIKQLNLDAWVHFPGFKQYDELPSYYGLASCFIHASTTEQWGLVVNEAMASGLPVLVSDRCGCAPDLVRNGENGYTFDPYNVDQLSALMVKVSSKTLDLTTMGQVSQTIIDQWTPVTFAVSLQKAAEMALALAQPTLGWSNLALLWALSRR